MVYCRVSAMVVIIEECKEKAGLKVQQHLCTEENCEKDAKQ